MVDELLFARAGAIDIDCRENPAFDETAVQMNLAVAGTFKLLENDLVHPATGVDQRGGDDRETAGTFDVSGGTKEALGFLQRIRFQAARHRLSPVAGERVVGPGEPGNRIQQDDDVLPLLDQAPGLLTHHLGAVDVTLGRLIKRGRNHFTLRVPAEIRDLLGALVDQKQNQLHLGAVRRNRVGDVLHQHGLAGARRGHNQAALAETDRSQNVDGPHGHVFRDLFGFQQNTLQRIIGRQLLKRRYVGNGLGREPHDFVNPHDGRTTIAGLRRLHQHLHVMAALQTIAGHQTFRQISIVRVEPIIALCVHDKRAAVRHIDIAAVQYRPLGRRRRRKNLRLQRPPVRRTFERDPLTSGKRSEFGQR